MVTKKTEKVEQQPTYTFEEFDAYLEGCSSIEEAREDLNPENFTNVVNRVLSKRDKKEIVEELVVDPDKPTNEEGLNSDETEKSEN